MDSSQVIMDHSVSNLLLFQSEEEIPTKLDPWDRQYDFFGESSSLKEYISSAREKMGREEFVDYITAKWSKIVSASFREYCDADMDEMINMFKVNGLVSTMVLFSYIDSAGNPGLTLEDFFHSDDAIIAPSELLQRYKENKKNIYRKNLPLSEEGLRLGYTVQYLPDIPAIESKSTYGNLRIRNWMPSLFGTMMINVASSQRPCRNSAEEQSKKSFEEYPKSTPLEDVASFDQRLLHFVNTWKNIGSTNNYQKTLDGNERRVLKRKIDDFSALMSIIQRLTLLQPPYGDICDQAMLCYLQELIFHPSAIAILFHRLEMVTQKEETVQSRQLDSALNDAAIKSSYPLAFHAENINFKKDSYAGRECYLAYLRALAKTIYCLCEKDVNSCCELLREYINKSFPRNGLPQCDERHLVPPDAFFGRIYYTSEVMLTVTTQILSCHNYFLHNATFIDSDIDAVTVDTPDPWSDQHLTVKVIR